MKDFTPVVVNLYSNQLNEPHRSFDLNLTVSDFKQYLFYTIKDAHIVKYVNPKGETITLKDRYARIE